jgi:hypothetical protein
MVIGNTVYRDCRLQERHYKAYITEPKIIMLGQKDTTVYRLLYDKGR